MKVVLYYTITQFYINIVIQLYGTRIQNVVTTGSCRNCMILRIIYRCQLSYNIIRRNNNIIRC